MSVSTIPWTGTDFCVYTDGSIEKLVFTPLPARKSALDVVSSGRFMVRPCRGFPAGPCNVQVTPEPAFRATALVPIFPAR